MKITALGSVLAKRFDLPQAQELVPSLPTLGDVDSPEALERFQAAKRAYKASLRTSSPSPVLSSRRRVLDDRLN